jgi:hypothetical protein
MVVNRCYRTEISTPTSDSKAHGHLAAISQNPRLFHGMGHSRRICGSLRVTPGHGRTRRDGVVDEFGASVVDEQVSF